MQNWFHADAHNQQQGPVDAAALAAAFRDGRITADTLVWREGLAGWVPLAQVAAQIGLIIVREPARAPVSGARVAARPPASTASTAIIVIACVFGGLLVIGAILAAIAVPAYQDYVLRSQVAQALVVGESIKLAVEERHGADGQCPHNGDGDIGSADSYANAQVASIEVGPSADESGDCAIVLTLASTHARINGKRVSWMLDADGDWHAASDVPPRFLPISLRQAIE